MATPMAEMAYYIPSACEVARWKPNHTATIVATTPWRAKPEGDQLSEIMVEHAWAKKGKRGFRLHVMAGSIKCVCDRPWSALYKLGPNLCDCNIICRREGDLNPVDLAKEGIRIFEIGDGRLNEYLAVHDNQFRAVPTHGSL